MSRISVVIPTPSLTDETYFRCVRHLEATQLDEPFEMIPVEESGPAFSFGKSMNRGIKQADGDRVVLMDSDAFPEEKAIKKIVRFSYLFPDVGYFGARVKTGRIWGLGWVYSNNPIHLLRQAILTPAPVFAMNKAWKDGLFSWDIRIVNRFVKGMTGQTTSFCLVRKQCWKDVGGFDERFRCSYADVDFCYRVILSDKWKVSVCPVARVHHIGHATRARTEQCWADNTQKSLYEEKWPHEKVLEVVEASKEGGFVIPEFPKSPRTGWEDGKPR